MPEFACTFFSEIQQLTILQLHDFAKRPTPVFIPDSENFICFLGWEASLVDF
jgi:hypothetical protein